MSAHVKDFLPYYNEFFEKVYRYIFFRVGRNRELAEDLTSEIFIKALESFENFDHTRPFAVWIYRIAHNHLTDYYKKIKKTMVPIEDYVNELKSNESIPHDASIAMDIEKIKNVLNDLPDVHREVIVMKYINQLENTEIAEILHTTEANIRVMQYRALQMLKKRLYFLA